MPLSATQVLPAHISSDFRAPTEFLNREGTTLSHLYDWNARENPNYPLFLYHDPASTKLEYITYSTANEAFNRTARYLTHSVGGRQSTTPTGLPVLGCLANADTISYFCTIVGAFRAGFSVLLISMRNAPLAVADMAKRAGVTHFFVSPDLRMNEMADEAARLLAADGVEMKKHAMPLFGDLFPDVPDESSLYEKEVEFPTSYDVKAPSAIIHSSGSTGHPKPMVWTHQRMISIAWGALKSNALTGTIMSGHGTPMFHGLGAFMYAAAPTTGFVVATFKPASPPLVPTPDAVWQGISRSGSDFSWSVPSFIEGWSRDPEKVVYMKGMRGVMFGGASLNDDVGNALAAQGVSLHTIYGTSEVGSINTFARPNPGMDWAYFAVAPSVKSDFRPTGDGTYELIIISSPDCPLPVTNTKVGDQDAYATGDLVVPHPTKPDLWKVVGRADEQIILSNGEKTNPVPLETMINGDPHVHCSVMFGRGKFQNGILIEPAKDFAVDPTDVKKVEEYRNKIWRTIERVNAYAPQHSRIFKEMILVTNPAKPFQFNAKALPRRGIILKEYNDEIEALYEAVESSAQSDFAPPATWDEASTLAFVRDVVQGTLHRPLADDADIFRNGGDSLQATWIRNTLLRAVRDTDKDAAQRLPMNIVFSAPTIAALAALLHGAVHSSQEVESRTPEDLWRYVEKYSADFPARPAKLVERAAGQKDVVVITGTTGGFGCDTLEHLLRDETVGRVYAFNRKGADALERQRKQFAARGLDGALLDSPKFRMVEAVLHEPGFGIGEELLAEIRTSVTHIMLSAWKVNFNLLLASFEQDIQGMRNFVDLALSSPYTKAPTVMVVSSVSVFLNCKIAPPVPEIPLDDPSSPFGTGYGESKWVAEHVLQNVAAQRGVHTIVMRLGQVAGDRKGYWNESEWFPILVKSALFQKCLPEHDGKVTWFPAYEAAKAFTEIRHSPEPIVHLVHPRPVSWRTVLEPIAKELNVPLVPYTQWLSALEDSVEQGSAEEVEAMRVNPALRLLAFYKAQSATMTPDREAMGLVFISTDKAVQVSESLTRLPQLDAERARMWLAAWKKSGFLSSSEA